MTLDEVRQDTFRLLSRGVADRRSAFRSPALATVGADGWPEVRTVVLRAFDASARVLTVHSDLRAAKIGALKAGGVALHVWDERAMVQLRMRGRATVVAGEPARADWAALHAGSRAAYTVALQPGTVIDDPVRADAERVDEGAAFANFAVVRMELSGFEWLHLAKGGHRRARFVWSGAAWSQDWLVP